MKKFIFYTLEGYTESPTGAPIENIQVLGFEEGNSIKEANKKLIKTRPWIIKSGFSEQEIVYKQLLDDKTKGLIKTIIDYHGENAQEQNCKYSVPDYIFSILEELKKVIE